MASKGKYISTMLPFEVYDIMIHEVKSTGLSSASYFRSLIYKDLTEKGLINNDNKD